MKAIVNKWGNSLAVRIPQALAEKLGLSEGATVDLESTDDTLTLKRRVLTLDDVLRGHQAPEKELDWGPAKGREER